MLPSRRGRHSYVGTIAGPEFVQLLQHDFEADHLPGFDCPHNRNLKIDSFRQGIPEAPFGGGKRIDDSQHRIGIDALGLFLLQEAVLDLFGDFRQLRDGPSLFLLDLDDIKSVGPFKDRADLARIQDRHGLAEILKFIAELDKSQVAALRSACARRALLGHGRKI